MNINLIVSRRPIDRRAASPSAKRETRLLPVLGCAIVLMLTFQITFMLAQKSRQEELLNELRFSIELRGSGAGLKRAPVSKELPESCEKCLST
ncbi:MAG: hypothetical protein ACK5NY_04625 [Burkholderiaceae bacterium]|jgi:hypothetical protein